MIKTIQLGEKHKDVVHVKFGAGEIMFTKVEMDDKSLGLAFKHAPGHSIGEVTDRYAGKSVDEMEEEIRVLFTFSKPESITALMHSLLELQKAMFDGRL